jgi:hypothetical protein
MELGLGKSTGIPRLLMVVVMLMALPSLVANSTSIETGSPLKGPGSSSLGVGLKAQRRPRRSCHRIREAGDLPQQRRPPLLDFAVGNAPDQQVGSIVFDLPADPNTSAGNEKLDPTMWRTYGDDNAPCRIEIERRHGDMWVFDDTANGRQKIALGGWRARCHLPQATGSGQWGFVYIHDLYRSPGHIPR